MILGRCSVLQSICLLRYLKEIKVYDKNKRFLYPSNLFVYLTRNKSITLRFQHKISLKMASTCSLGKNNDGLRKNKLAMEKSPYLLQHSYNPVDWYPWSQEALEKAKKEDKMIFLSVGYSTCHWCHVMEKESFENPEIAKIMNRYFINIKVDREERPDIDKIYMTFIQSISGHGGWPMSVFLTPTLMPVMGGTYFPPEDKYGHPSFRRILMSIAEKWLENKSELTKSGLLIYEVLKSSVNHQVSKKDLPSEDCGKRCVQQLMRSYDREFGGFSDAPKFPQPVNLNFLFHIYSREPKSELSQECLNMCLYTLKKMANGGIHDHIGQGFARYSVDGKWHVPHFEKMLYDQGQLLKAYSFAFIATKDPFYYEIIDDIINYVTRDLRHKDGGYYSAEDADSLPTFDAKSKREGAFYVWTAEEIDLLLNKSISGHDNLKLSEIFSYHFNIKSDGNVKARQDPHGELTGQNVLIVFGSEENTADKFQLSVDDVKKYINEAKNILFDVRSKRPRPHLDDKIVSAWNGLIISGLSHAAIATKNNQYIQFAKDAAQFVKKYLFDNERKILLRSCYRDEGDIIVQPSVPIDGFHADYSFMIQGLVDLYEASLETQWLEFAIELQDIQDKLFWDCQDGAYFNVTDNDDNIILRLKDDNDGAEPSSNSVASSNLLRLASYLDRNDLNKKALELFTYFSDTLTRIPIAAPELVCGLLHYHDTATQIFIVGKKDSEDTLKLLNIIRDRLILVKVLVLIDPDDKESIIVEKNEVASKMKRQNNQATVYVCRHRTCSLPVVEPQQLAQLLDERD